MPDENEEQVVVEPEVEETASEQPAEQEDVVLTKSQLEQLLAESSAKIEKRFKDTQAALTKTQQENAEFRKRFAEIDSTKPKESDLIWARIEEEGETRELRDAYTKAIIAEASNKPPEPETPPEVKDWMQDREAFIAANPKVDIKALDEHFGEKKLKHSDFYLIYQVRTGQARVVPVGAEKKPVPTLPKGGGTPPVNAPRAGSNYDAIEEEYRKQKKIQG